ncbi:MAG: Tryptophan--tRNA ligase [candidate division WS2 bacterium ADurb.Bin280]|uniref:Tryptophan--tRNA ligase n=1 Tax=candidate division WS2 bacterium ADurb.Bin280 TaxID=1852829 RepID=A0A1V5SH04_9BACT|nr:MAG: Tryptophan--tRNA ligase [candidate division WS2 bacterium ADurb.Bin280]
MKKIFSGIQPTNVIHIGNYLGALKNWVALQDEGEAIYCIVDLHAITVPQDPKILKEKILETAALFIACGVDPSKATLFVQSSRPEHSELSWILNCFTGMGELKRMTQFKDKSGGDQDNVTAGLFDYPVLMAADILLYQTTHVPVGEDQKQHIEITRDIAQRINSKYGETFTVPEPIIKQSTARIMALDDPSKKMSKSSPNASSFIALTDTPDQIREKIKKATTDSGSEIKSSPTGEKPAITNLLRIFSGMTGREIPDIEREFEGKGYGEFKNALAEAIIEELEPIHKKFEELMADKEALHQILTQGSQKIAPLAQETLNKVKEKVGLGI